MLSQLYQSYMTFAWDLLAAFMIVLTPIILIVARHIAFGEGVLTIQVGRLIILQMEIIDNGSKRSKK